MKFNFRKISAVMASALMTVSAVGFAAAGFPTTFLDDSNDDFAIVYGTGPGSLDQTPAMDMGEYLKSLQTSEDTVTEVTFEASAGVTENEVTFNSEITFGGSNVKSVLTDNKIPSLFDGKLSWDDGLSSDDTFNVHEELLIGEMNLITNLLDDELESLALTNNKALEYRYVFEDILGTSRIGHEDADSLVINFLGEEVEISNLESDEVTFTKGTRHLLNKGDTLTLKGKTLVLESVFEDKVYVSVEGESRRIRNGETARIQGIEVRLSETLYQGYAGGIEKASLVISEDIESTISDGDAYFGEDLDDPKWVWSISNPGAEEDGWIGVRYDQKELDSDDDLVYLGESYVFPKNFAQVSLTGVTDIEYEDFELSFDDSMDLYSADKEPGKIREDKSVVIIKGDTDESILIGGDTETDSMYLYYNLDDKSVEVYYKDVNKDVSDSSKVRYLTNYSVGEVTNESGYVLRPFGLETITLGKLLVDDTELSVILTMDEDSTTLSLGDVNVLIGGTEGSFEYLGSRQEDADNDDVSIGNKSIGTREDSVVNNYGTIVINPEGNADTDEVILSVPSEQVFGKVSVLGADISTDTTIKNELNLGSLVVKDNEVNSVSNKNLIVVGGSCINAEAARLLKVAPGTCGDAFTAATGVKAGEYLLQIFASEINPENVVILVAGYHAADTQRGLAALKASTDLEITAGQKYIG